MVALTAHPRPSRRLPAGAVRAVIGSTIRVSLLICARWSVAGRGGESQPGGDVLAEVSAGLDLGDSSDGPVGRQ